MGADMRFYQIGFVAVFPRPIDFAGKTDIFLDACLKFLQPAVTVSGFKAGHAAQADLDEGVTQLA